MGTAGVILAAGGGTRMGRPKGLLTDARGEPWVRLAVTALLDARCSPVLVVTGARAADVAALVPAPATSVRAVGWEAGMSASLRTGLTALERLDEVDAVIVSLVDMPDVTAEVVRRIRRSVPGGTLRGALARAAYDGEPGHPVLIGRDHWGGVLATAKGDTGARHYLRDRTDVRLVEAGDLSSGADIDHPLPET